MVSRWNYVAITAVMLITLFLFQFTNVMLERWNNYEENSYVRDMEELPGREDAYSIEGENPLTASRNQIVYIGDAGEKLGEVVHTWATYSKWGIQTFDSVESYETFMQRTGASAPQIIALNATQTDWEQGLACEYLEKCATEGITIVFCNLPDVTVIENSKALRRLLGIAEVRETETTVKGLYLYGGFLLGGEAMYWTDDDAENAKRQDMELTFPWYVLSEDTRLYMRGLCEDESVDEKESPAVIWRSEREGSRVYAVNGDYMEDAAGLGLLTAMWSKSKDYDIYPVVNAQNLVTANYPGLSNENEDAMQQRYGRDVRDLFRDVVWPSLVSVYRKNTLGLSCMIAPQFDYEDDILPDQEQLLYYMRRINEEKVEAGLSAICVSDTPLSKKLTEDRWLMEMTLPTYQFTSFYAGNLGEGEVEAALQEEFLKRVRTIVADYDGESKIIAYQNGNVTRQSVLTDGTRHTYREDFRVKGVETALGYTVVLADMNKVVYFATAEDALTESVSSLRWNVHNSFKNFREFEGTTLSESDERIRSFLSLDYAQHREDNTIYVESDGFRGSAWFILRCDGDETVSGVRGGTFKQLERDVYLIESQSENVEITLRLRRHF